MLCKTGVQGSHFLPDSHLRGVIYTVDKSNSSSWAFHASIGIGITLTHIALHYGEGAVFCCIEMNALHTSHFCCPRALY